jgi:hypothetical protein
LRNAKIQEQQQNRALQLQQNLDAKMPANATELDYQNLANYTQLFGEAPQETADGKFDMAGAANRVKAVNAQKLIAAYSGTGKLTPEQEMLAKAFEKRGREADLIDPATGGFRNAATLRSIMEDWPAMLPKDAAAAQSELTSLQQKRANMARALEIVNDPNQKVVGPMVGSKPGKWLVWAQAAAGGDQKQYSSQQEMETVVAANILANVSQMKGALSDKDVKFLQGSVPGLNSTPEFWNRFGTQFNAALDRQISNTERSLKGETPDMSELFDAHGNVVAPDSKSVPQPPPPGPGAPAVDYSAADKEPPITKDFPNSVLMRSTLITVGGQPAFQLPGSNDRYYLLDDQRSQILALRSRFGLQGNAPGKRGSATPPPVAPARTNATFRPIIEPAPTAAPAVRTGVPWGQLLQNNGGLQTAPSRRFAG